MLIVILLAILNGLFISLSRTFNGVLGTHKGALWASCCNHITGFLCLTLYLFLTSGVFPNAFEFQVYLLLGGVFGALYVWLNTLVIAHTGVLQSVLLVLTGQMLSALTLDLMVRHVTFPATQLLAMSLILAGVLVSLVKRDSDSG